jgi:hypothetical protein
MLCSRLGQRDGSDADDADDEFGLMMMAMSERRLERASSRFQAVADDQKQGRRGT